MPAKMHQIVVDTPLKALLGLMTYIGMILLTSGAAIVIWHDLMSSTVPAESVATFSETFLSWFVWEEPLATLAVIVPLAIALQVAVHGLRGEQNRIRKDAAHAIRVRDHEIRRVRLFSQTASFSAALVLVFTMCTVPAEIFGINGEPDGSMAITVALTGVVTALLCLDAARVATTQDLEKRLFQDESLLNTRKQLLAKLKRDLPRPRRLWLNACLLAVILTAPGAYLEVYHPHKAEPFSGWEGPVMMIALMVAASTVLVVCLALCFLALVALTQITVSETQTTIPVLTVQLSFWMLIALVTYSLTVFRLRDGGSAEFAYLYPWVWIVFPTVALISAMTAWVQGSLGSSSWVTRYSFGFAGLFRLLNARIMSRLVRNTHYKVSWLREMLRSSIAADSSSTRQNRNCTGLSHRQLTSRYWYHNRPGN